MSDFLKKCRYEETAKRKKCPITKENCWVNECQWWDRFSGIEKPSGWCTLPDNLDKEVVDLVRKEFKGRRPDGKTEAGVS